MRYVLFLNFRLDLLQQLQIIYHLHKRIFIQIINIKIMSRDVVYDLLIYFWLLEIRQHLLFKAH